MEDFKFCACSVPLRSVNYVTYFTDYVTFQESTSSSLQLELIFTIISTKMKNIETLLAEARKIISQEHLSPSPKTYFNARAHKRFRKFFVKQCLTELGEPFKERVTGYIPVEYKAM